MTILEGANSFKLAAERCDEQKILDTTTVEWLLIPCLTNYAFACELYLKKIIKSETGTDEHGHNLECLYEKLQISTQKIIRNELSRSNKALEQEELFDEILNEVRSYFVNMRYFHENPSIETTLHYDFLKVLCNTLCRIANA